MACIALGVCLLAACGQNDGAPPFAARDSAGIRLVHVDRDRLSVMFDVDSTPSWVLGSPDGAVEGLELHEVTDATLIGEHEVAIAEASTQQVIRVDLASGDVMRYGRAGDGPEEFRGLTQVYDAGGDRIGAFDRVRNRYVEIDRAGAFVEVTEIPSVNQLGSNYLQRASDGILYLAAVTSFPVDPAPGARRGSGVVLRIGASTDTVTMIRGNSVFFEQDAMGGVLFGATTVVAPAPSGLWVGDTDQPEAVLWGPDRIQSIVRWTSSTARLLTEERREEFWQHMEEGVPPEQSEMLADAKERMHFADTIPAFGSLATAPYGDLWIGSFVPPEPFLLQEAPPPQEWMIIDFEAGEAGLMTAPAGFRVLQVGENFIIGVHMDELGIETLRRYDLMARG